MTSFLSRISLPLLTKELIEQSARKRTYIVRTIYAIVLYVTALWFFRLQLGSGMVTGFSILGQGRTLYEVLAKLEFCGIYLFLPAMTCGVFTAEKERDTLGLLLLTKLGPWTIVFEKLFSRLVPMATFVLLSLPLLAVAYSLGGIEAVDIAKLMWVLAVTALQVGSFAVLCSAWFRTTAAAFLATYLLGAMAIGAVGFFFQFIMYRCLQSLFYLSLSQVGYQLLFSDNSPSHHLEFLAFGPWILDNPNVVRNSVFAPGWGEHTLLNCISMTLPMLGMSLVTLAIARFVLWKRAFVQSKNIMLKLFQSLDRFFHWANNNQFTQGIVLIKESVVLPRHLPISWRETSKRSLGTTRYLIRFLLLLEVPVLFMILWPASDHSIRSGYAPAYVSGWILWTVATLVLAIQSTGLIGTERSHQSLDVLLTTPIESDEIVRQKFAGIWRMTRMLWVPFATLYLFQMWWEAWVNTPSANYHSQSSNMMYVCFRAVLSVGLYLPTVAWFGFYQGLRCRSQTQAILTTMTAIAVTCVGPMMIAWFLTPPPRFGPGFTDPSMAPLINWFSPAFVLSVTAPSDGDWILLFFHFVVVAGVYLSLAYYSQKSFAKRVGRNDGLDDEEPEHSVTALTFDERMARLRRGQVEVRAVDELE